MNFRKPLAALLCSLIAFPPTAVRAQIPDELVSSRPRLTISFSIPFSGRLDQYHSPQSRRDPIANSLYALRNVAVEDLLNTRKALKILMGGDARLRRAAGSDGLQFAVPVSVQRLYVTGAVHSARDVDASLGWEEPELAGATRAVEETASENEFGDSIRWLGNSSPTYSATLRGRLAMGLADASAQIVKFDQQIRFLETDWWDHPVIAREFRRSSGLAAMERLSAASGAPMVSGAIGSYTHYQQLKQEFMQEHGVDRELMVLRANRDLLLNRYHLLALERDGRPLYRHLYEAMERRGFPRADTVQAPSPLALPAGHDLIPVPRAFDERLDEELGELAESASQRTQLGRDFNPLITRALVESLRKNTERLEALCSEINYNTAASSELLALARHPELWEAARERYGYMAGPIDFHQGEELIRAYFRSADRTAAALTYAGYAGSIGVGVAAVIATGGAAAVAGAFGVEAGALGGGAVFGLSASQWVWGSALFTAGFSYARYADAAREAAAEGGTFYGGTRFGDHAVAHDTSLIARDRYRWFIASLVLAGVDMFRIRELARLVPVYERMGQSFVALTRPQRDALLSALARITPRLRTLVPGGMALLSYLNRTLDVVTGSGLVTFEQALPAIAAQLRMSVSAVRARAAVIPGIGRILAQHGNKVRAAPSVLVKVLREASISGVMSFVAQMDTRGEHFSDELGNVVVTVGASFISTGLLTYITYGASENFRGRPAAAVAERVHQLAGRNFWVGVGTNGLSAGLVETIDEINNPERRTLAERSHVVASRMIFGGLFMATSSTLRSALTRRLEETVERRLSTTGTQLIMMPLSVANNYFGSWQIVHLVNFLGVEASYSRPTLEPSEFEELGTAYVRVDNDPAAETYMFDFLRDGDH